MTDDKLQYKQVTDDGDDIYHDTVQSTSEFIARAKLEEAQNKPSASEFKARARAKLEEAQNK